MTECRNKWFIKKSTEPIILKRKRGNRQTVSVRAFNHSQLELTPVIGLSANGSTVVDTITGTRLVPEANCLMEIPAIDANDNEFDEQYVHLYFIYHGIEAEETNIQEGIEFNLMQYEGASLLSLYTDSHDVLSN